MEYVGTYHLTIINMINIILNFFGLFLLVFAIFYNRRGVSQLKTFSRKWWLVLIFLIIGVSLLQTAQERKTIKEFKTKVIELLKEIEAEKTVQYL